jgi:hypothetical protein
MGQEVRCRAFVERTVVEAGEQFMLTVEISGGDLNITSVPQLPPMKGVDAIYPNAGESTSIQVINGKKSETRNYQFLLRAKDVGRWTIPAITLYDHNKPYASQPLIIEAVPSGSISGTGSAEASGDVFLAMEVSKKDVFVGEQITAVLKIYTRVSVTQYSPSKVPNFVGFWAEDFPIPQTLQADKEMVDGVAYSSYTIKRSAIFPTHAGKLSIEPAEIECELRIPQKNKGSLFGDFFSDPFGKIVTTKLQSKSVEINVKELPTQNKPVNFSGLVGNFGVKAFVDKNTVKTGEALVYRIEISGTGNLISSEAPPNPFSDEFEKYNAKAADDINRSGSLISGKKAFEYVAIPRASRNFEIPPFTLVYFDPILKKYISKSTAAMSITVTRGAAGASQNASLSQEEVALLAEDIRYIKSGVNWQVSNEGILTRWWFIVLWVLPIASSIGGYFYIQQRDKFILDADALKYKKSSPLAKKRLRAAEKLMRKNQVDTFYYEIAKTLTGLVADKLKIPEASMMREDLQNKLTEKNVDEVVVKEYLKCLQLCDEARFAPNSKSDEHMEGVYLRIRSALFNMDKAL